MKDTRKGKIGLTIMLDEKEGPASIRITKGTIVALASVSATTMREAFDLIPDAVEKLCKEMEEFKDPDMEYPCDFQKEEHDREIAEKERQDEKLNLEGNRKVKVFLKDAEKGHNIIEKHSFYDLDLLSLRYSGKYMDRYDAVASIYYAGFYRGVKFEKRNHDRKE